MKSKRNIYKNECFIHHVTPKWTYTVQGIYSMFITGHVKMMNPHLTVYELITDLKITSCAEVGCNIILTLCVSVSVCVHLTLLSKWTDLQTWYLARRSSGRITRSRSQSWKYIFSDILYEVQFFTWPRNTNQEHFFIACLWYIDLILFERPYWPLFTH